MDFNEHPYLDENTVVVEQSETPMIDLMRSLVVKWLPVLLIASTFWGGFHCARLIFEERELCVLLPALDAKSGKAD